MAIGTNDSVAKFGTQDTVTSSSSSVADASFSVSGDVTTWTNDDDAERASIVLECTFSVAPDEASIVNLYARMMNIQSTNDQDTPDANYQHMYLGFFPLNDVTSAQYIPIDVDLPLPKSSTEIEYYIENLGGQTISAGWDLYVTPKTSGPHA